MLQRMQLIVPHLKTPRYDTARHSFVLELERKELHPPLRSVPPNSKNHAVGIMLSSLVAAFSYCGNIIWYFKHQHSSVEDNSELG